MNTFKVKVKGIRYNVMPVRYNEFTSYYVQIDSERVIFAHNIQGDVLPIQGKHVFNTDFLSQIAEEIKSHLSN